jgi:dienelactone hydrolase
VNESMQLQPVSDDVYEIYRDQFGYLKQNLEPRLVSSKDWPHWREETVHIRSPYAEDGMNLLMLLPHSSEPPLQAVILMPGSDAFNPAAKLAGYDWEDYEPSVATLLHSGRAVVLPVWDNAFSRGRRWAGDSSGDQQAYREFTRNLVMHWRQDLGTAIDYLETRKDIDHERIGFLGISYGAIRPVALLAVETRLKTAVLVAGGLGADSSHPLVKPVNHASRVRIPVLMLNGRYDYGLPLESRQKPLFELLGSAPEQKKHVVYEAGHVGFPVRQQRREIGAWLDAYLGRVR